MRRTLTLAVFVAAIAIAVLLAAQRAHSLDAGVDGTAPVGSVSLPAVVPSVHVQLTLKLRDPESGLDAVRASNDGSLWGDWQAPPAPSPTGKVLLDWDLAAGDGAKTVTVEARNNAGLVASFTATTTLDTVAPTLISTEPAGGAALAAPPASFVLHYSEPLASPPLPTATLPGVAVSSVAVAGSDVTVTPVVKAFVPTSSYTLTVDGVRDPAGNAAAPAVLDFSTDPWPATLKLAASAATVTYGASVTLKGSIVPAGAAVALEAKAVTAGDFSPLADLTAGTTGRFNITVQPAATTTYRAAFGDDQHYLAAGATVDVRVRPKLTFTTPPGFWLGQTRTFKGTVAPAQPGATVTIQRYRGGTWVDWRTPTLDASSAFVERWKPTAYGISKFRLVMPAGVDLTRAVTTARRVVVNNPNPHHISVLYKHFIVVDLSECHLYYYETGRVVKIFDCVVGKPSTPTPIGQWTVYQKVVGMWGPYGPFTMWYHYPYHFGIHGTNEPNLLSLFPRHFSHGCTRLSNPHISWLFPRVPVGTPVRNIR